MNGKKCHVHTVCNLENFQGGLRNFSPSHGYSKVYIRGVKQKEAIMCLCIFLHDKHQKMVLIMQKHCLSKVQGRFIIFKNCFYGLITILVKITKHIYRFIISW